MKTTLHLFLFAFMALLTTGCTPGVTVQKKPGTDFSQYRTYDWAKTDVKSADSANPIYQSTLNDQQIRAGHQRRSSPSAASARPRAVRSPIST